MSGARNHEHAETVGLGPSIISVAQPWPELPAQMERFLELTFLVVGRDEAKVTESRHEKTPLAEASGGNKFDQFRTNKWSTTKTSIVTEMWLES